MPPITSQHIHHHHHHHHHHLNNLSCFINGFFFNIYLKMVAFTLFVYKVNLGKKLKIFIFIFFNLQLFNSKRLLHCNICNMEHLDQENLYWYVLYTISFHFFFFFEFLKKKSWKVSSSFSSTSIILLKTTVILQHK